MQGRQPAQRPSPDCRTHRGSRGSQVRIPRTHRDSCHNKVVLFKRLTLRNDRLNQKKYFNCYLSLQLDPPGATKQLLPNRRCDWIIQFVPELVIIGLLYLIFLKRRRNWRTTCVVVSFVEPSISMDTLRVMRKNWALGILFATFTNSFSNSIDFQGFSNSLSGFDHFGGQDRKQGNHCLLLPERRGPNSFLQFRNRTI